MMKENFNNLPFNSKAKLTEELILSAQPTLDAQEKFVSHVYSGVRADLAAESNVKRLTEEREATEQYVKIVASRDWKVGNGRG